jgi:hypothetical protein
MDEQRFAGLRRRHRDRDSRAVVREGGQVREVTVQDSSLQRAKCMLVQMRARTRTQTHRCASATERQVLCLYVQLPAVVKSNYQSFPFLSHDIA